MNRTLTIILASTLARVAAADSAETADQALKRGQAAYKAGRVHEACDAYATSDKLAQSLDTELMLASCYEQDGKPVTAAKLYRSVADKAGDRNAALAKATKLEAKAPRLRFAINPMPAGLVVKVDGAVVSATDDVPVDLGPHEVTASAPGYAGHASAPADRDHAIVDVIVRMEPHADAAPTPAPAPAISTSPPPTPEQPAPAPMSTSPQAGAPMAAMPEHDDHDDGMRRDHRTRNGIIAAAVGGGVLIASAIMYGVAESKFDDEHSLCPDSKCANNTDLAKASSLLSDARAYRDVGIGTSIGGGLILIAGGYFLLARHHQDPHVSLSVGHDTAGMAYTGRF
jgi:hypothetical protein